MRLYVFLNKVCSFLFDIYTFMLFPLVCRAHALYDGHTVSANQKKKKSINYQMIYLWLHFRREKKVAFLTVLNALDVPQYMISNIYP